MIKKNDFIRLNYTGRLDSGEVFDTTEETIAKKEHLHLHDLKPVIVCVGNNFLVESLDQDFIGKKLGRYTIKISEAFGKKRVNLLTLIPISAFKKENIKPMPGLEVNIDGNRGLVKTVSGGRIIVDFNHPLAGRNVSYNYEIIELVNDKKEQVDSLLPKEIKTEFKDDTVIIKSKVPEELKKIISKQLEDHVKIKVKFED